MCYFFLHVIRTATHLIHEWSFLPSKVQRASIYSGCSILETVVRNIYDRGGWRLARRLQMHRRYAFLVFRWLIFVSTLCDPWAVCTPHSGSKIKYGIQRAECINSVRSDIRTAMRIKRCVKLACRLCSRPGCCQGVLHETQLDIRGSSQQSSIQLYALVIRYRLH